jgi:hypothetical protein
MSRRLRRPPDSPALWLAGLLLLAGPALAQGAQGAESRIRFREAAADWGLDFRHHHGGSGKRYMAETVVGGVVIFDYAGLIKIDLLGLGMLTALQDCLAYIQATRGKRIDLGQLEQDPAVYDDLCRADSVGVFQVESRAQMNTLPRLKPRTFYDLVVQVSLIRPGPTACDNWRGRRARHRTWCCWPRSGSCWSG